jgi:hypothetical protein
MRERQSQKSGKFGSDFSSAAVVRLHQPEVCITTEDDYPEAGGFSYLTEARPFEAVTYRCENVLARVIGPNLLELKLVWGDTERRVTFSGPFSIFWPFE